MTDAPPTRFIVRLYADPVVAALCLILQDQLGADVPVLLYLAWLASRGDAAGGDDVACLEARMEPLRTHVIHPLRAARRQLKKEIIPSSERASRLREHVKQVELEAELLGLALLHEARPAHGGHAPDRAILRSNLRQIIPLLGEDARRLDLLDQLEAALWDRMQAISDCPANA